MDYWRREQIGVASGVVAVALFVIGGSLITSYPAAEAGAQEIRTFVLDNRTTLLTQALIMAGAVAFGLWFFGSLRSVLRRAEGGTGRLSGIVFAGGVGVLLGALAGSVLSITAASRVAETAEPGVTLALWQLGNAATVVAVFPFVAAVLATSLLALRTGVLPRWLAYAGVIPVGLCALAPISIYYESGRMGLGSTFTFGATFGGILGWVLVTSVVLALRLASPMETVVARRRITDMSQEPPRAVEM